MLGRCFVITLFVVLGGCAVLFGCGIVVLGRCLRVSTVFPKAPAGSLFYGDPGVSREFTENSPWQISPIVGLTYDVRGDGKAKTYIGDPEEPGETYSRGVTCWCMLHSSIRFNFPSRPIIVRDVLRASKSDLKSLMEQEKAANTHKPKRGPKPKSKVAE